MARKHEKAQAPTGAPANNKAAQREEATPAAPTMPPPVPSGVRAAIRVPEKRTGVSAHWGRLAAVIEDCDAIAQRTAKAHSAAVDEVRSAQQGFDELIAEISAIMPLPRVPAE